MTIDTGNFLNLLKRAIEDKPKEPGMSDDARAVDVISRVIALYDNAVQANLERGRALQGERFYNLILRKKDGSIEDLIIRFFDLDTYIKQSKLDKAKLMDVVNGVEQYYETKHGTFERGPNIRAIGSPFKARKNIEELDDTQRRWIKEDQGEQERRKRLNEEGAYTIPQVPTKKTFNPQGDN